MNEGSDKASLWSPLRDLNLGPTEFEEQELYVYVG